VDSFDGTSWHRSTLGGMEDESFWDPPVVCDRCGRDFDVVVVYLARTSVTVDVCAVCDLDAAPISL
jgi:hypothetical protein